VRQSALCHSTILQFCPNHDASYVQQYRLSCPLCKTLWTTVSPICYVNTVSQNIFRVLYLHSYIKSRNFTHIYSTMYYTSDIKLSPVLAEISQLSNLCLCSKMSHKTSFCSLSTMFLFSSHTLSHLCCLYCHILRTKSSNEIYDLIYNIHTCSVFTVPRIQIISLVVFTECRILSTITSHCVTYS
jgi:hypothetical protein